MPVHCLENPYACQASGMDVTSKDNYVIIFLKHEVDGGFHCVKRCFEDSLISQTVDVFRVCRQMHTNDPVIISGHRKMKLVSRHHEHIEKYSTSTSHGSHLSRRLLATR
ncbi:hypothetical protein X801_07315 [Opisthorchis viverrini]|uniref:Uncharacterized protein n=1 Tax=Opisthorchis viverrini TaxID=6198 RepID=A0A1S8WQX3_OPIVI|nr:hypothetical protein X801_07315 [Opisthorchis viverrini]